MSDQLPEHINPLLFAEHGRRLKGTIPLSQLSRLTDLLVAGEGVVKVDLEFGKDGRTAIVTGTVEAELALQCQCCLEPLPWHVKSRVGLGVVTSIDAANLLAEAYEPLLLEGEVVAVADIVQDELLLALPHYPQHDGCRSVASGQEPKAEERPNPFGILAELKKS